MSQPNRREWVHGNFNAKKCAQYLRGIGIELLPSEVARWLTQEKLSRKERRRVRYRRAYECRKDHRWEVESRYRKQRDVICPRCGGPVVHGWLLWYDTGNGERHDYSADARRLGYDGPSEPWELGEFA